MKTKNKISDIITVVLFLALLFGFTAAFFALPDKAASAEEGRDLQQAPSFAEGYHDNKTGVDYVGADYMLHGKLADDFDEYFCDQFPLRKTFLQLKAFTETAFGRTENGGVLYKDGDLATIKFSAAGYEGKTEYFSEAHVEKGVANLNALCESLNVPVAVLLPPRSIDVKAEAMGYPTEQSDKLSEAVSASISDEYYVDLLDTMRTLHGEGAAPYFRTDHHWTVTGAYHAYAAVMESWGITPYAMEDFEFVTITEDFQGTSLRNGNFYYLDGEKLQLARYDGDEDFTVTTLSAALTPLEGGELDGLYDLSAADTVDAYSAFLHGKPVHMSITKEGEERETLLVIKDSFGHSLVPFLARHFNIVVMDLDNSMKVTNPISSLINKFDADRVLFVYNLENVISTNRLNLLKP